MHILSDDIMHLYVVLRRLDAFLLSNYHAVKYHHLLSIIPKKNLDAINNTSSPQVQLHQFNLTKVQLRRVIEMETMAQLKLNLAGAQKQGQRLRALHKNSL